MSSNVPFIVITKIVTLIIGISTGAVPVKDTTVAEQDEFNMNQIELHVLNYTDGSSHEQIMWMDIERDFENNNPGIDLIIESYAHEQYHTELRARIYSGNLPDVMSLWASNRSEYVYNVEGIIEDLSDDFDFSKLDNVAAIPQTVQGERLMVPLGKGYATSIMYANDRLLRSLGLEHPKSYDDLEAMVSIARKNNIEVLAIANADSWVMNACLFSTILGRYAGPNWIQRRLNDEVQFSDPEFIKALEVVVELYESGILSEYSLDLGYGDAPVYFANGESLFYMDGNWRLQEISSRFDPNEYSLINLPAFSNEQYSNSSSFALSAGFGIASDLNADTKVAALTFLNYLISQEVGEQYQEATDNMPSLKNFDFTNAVEQMQGLDKLLAFYKNVDASMVSDIYLPAYLNDSLNQGLRDLALGNISPKVLAAELDTEYDSFY